MAKIERSELQKLLAYDPETGVFIWRVAVKNVRAGDIAGGIVGNGYRHIQLARRAYKAHRLAWFYVYGEWPSADIDHINRDKDDNRIANLRLAAMWQNKANGGALSNNTSGYRGVSFEKGRWRARLMVSGRYHDFGYYDDPAVAYAAYMAGRKDLLGDFS
jgi:hypothetical protein